MLKKYSQSLDFAMAAVISFQDGRFEQAAACLRRAATCADVEETIAGLDDINQKLKSPTMARLLEVQAAKKSGKKIPSFIKKKMDSKKKTKAEFEAEEAAKKPKKPVKKVKANIENGDEDDSPEFTGMEPAPESPQVLSVDDTTGFDLNLDVDPGVSSEMNLDDLELDDDGDMTTELPSEDDDVMELPAASTTEEAAEDDDDGDEKDDGADDDDDDTTDGEDKDGKKDDEKDEAKDKEESTAATRKRVLSRTMANLAALNSQKAAASRK